MTMQVQQEKIYWHALKEVMDPEFPISVVDMGLIYDIKLKSDGVIEVKMTFTAVGCACTEWIKRDIETRLLKEPNIRKVEFNVVWSPPWTVDKMTEEGKRKMKYWGVSSR